MDVSLGNAPNSLETAQNPASCLASSLISDPQTPTSKRTAFLSVVVIIASPRPAPPLPRALPVPALCEPLLLQSQPQSQSRGVPEPLLLSAGVVILMTLAHLSSTHPLLSPVLVSSIWRCQSLLTLSLPRRLLLLWNIEFSPRRPSNLVIRTNIIS